MKLAQRVAALVAVVMFAVVLSQPAQAEGVAPAVDGARSDVAVGGMPEFPGPHGVVAVIGFAGEAIGAPTRALVIGGRRREA